MAVLVAILVIFALVVGTNKKARAWMTTKGSGKGLTDPKILIAAGIVVFNFISWAMIPWWWRVLRHTWPGFFVFNIGFWNVLYLKTIKNKDKDGKETGSNPTASKLASIIAIVLIAGLATTGWYEIRQGDLTEEEYREKVAAEKALAKEPVLAVVAKCRPATEFDSVEKIKTATKLYQERGLFPWQEAMKCWESMITKNMLPVRLAVVEAPTEELSELVKSPRIKGGAVVDWSAPEGCEISVNGEDDMSPCDEATYDTSLFFVQFHSVNDEPLQVEVVVRN